MLSLATGCGANDADQARDTVGTKSPARNDETVPAESADGRPNVVFVMTDDMDKKLLKEMPVVRSRMVDMGVTFDNAFVTQSLCCPSRATILRGQYPHNHTITSNDLPDGGAVRFRRLGLDDSTFATWLNDSGYRTGLVGKYLNNARKNYVPPGWDEWYGMTGMASDRTLNENGTIRHYPRAAVMTDVYREKALDFLRRATDDASDPPFMLWVGTFAPHLPADYSGRHADLYRGARLPKPPSFNERNVSDKPEWLRKMPPLEPDEVQTLQEEHRDRLRSLRDVDEMVGAILNLLREREELRDTHVVFTTDNGLQRGEHRLLKKNTPYEESAGVPLVIRGPGVPAGVAREQLVINNDFAPTFADWAGVETPSFVDGRSLAPLLGPKPPSGPAWRTAILNEHHQITPSRIPDYEAVRTTTHTYVQWETGERELYDLRRDPYELNSIDERADPSLMALLRTRLKMLRTCAGTTCIATEGP